jgi:hypothetical protein
MLALVAATCQPKVKIFQDYYTPFLGRVIYNLCQAPSLELLPKRKSVTGMNTRAKLSELNARERIALYIPP